MPFIGSELNEATSPSAPRVRASRSIPVASSALGTGHGQPRCPSNSKTRRETYREQAYYGWEFASFDTADRHFWRERSTRGPWGCVLWWGGRHCSPSCPAGEEDWLCSLLLLRVVVVVQGKYLARLRLTKRIEKKKWGEVEKDIKCVSLNTCGCVGTSMT